MTQVEALREERSPARACGSNDLHDSGTALTLERMAKTVADITMSLDGYVTGPGADPEHGLGIGGEPIHTWVFGDDPVDAAVLREALESTGAVVMGRRLFDIVDGPQGWNDDTMGYGAGRNQATSGPPVFVVTHNPPASWRLGPRFSFATSLTGAVQAARAAAGDKDVIIMGGGDTIRQAVREGLTDELRIHLSPIVMGTGTPLFRPEPGVEPLAMRQVGVRVSSNATHVTYEIAKS
jgi:dihydrofolate reductase